jgi:hypothetical protein
MYYKTTILTDGFFIPKRNSSLVIAKKEQLKQVHFSELVNQAYCLD